MGSKGGITITQRDKLLLVVLPALLIVIVYAFAFTKVPMGRLRALTTQLEAEQARSPRTIDIEAEKARARRLDRDLNKARAELQPLKEELGKLTASWTNSTERLLGNDMLSGLWAKHGLLLQEQQVLTNESAVTPALQQLADRARATLGHGRYPVLWEVKLQGGFLSMLDALEELSRSDIAAVPVALEMGENPRLPGKAWKIRLWQ
jgi:hypothetical protein